MGEPLPEDVVRFIYGNVETIDQSEILRILDDDREKEWDFADLASEVQSQPQVIRAHLTTMLSRGLLTTTMRGASLSCRYGISDPELEIRVSRLLRLYKERPVTMIKVVYERASEWARRGLRKRESLR